MNRTPLARRRRLKLAERMRLQIGSSGLLPPPFRSDAERRKCWETPYERLQKLKDFVERRCGGSVHDDGIPSEVEFAVPQEELWEKLAANKNIGGTGKPVQITPIDFPRRPAAIGRKLAIDLLSIDDDELDQITRLRTGPNRETYLSRRTAASAMMNLIA